MRIRKRKKESEEFHTYIDIFYVCLFSNESEGIVKVQYTAEIIKIYSLISPT